MSWLPISNRCKLFEKIAEDVWSHIVFNHTADTEVSEIGITNDIIAEIRNNQKANPNIGVWAKRGQNEAIYGNDIDIILETSIGNFVWYALQAKVLKLNGKYEGLNTLRGNEYQWDKLKRLATESGCIVKYLFYNGVDDFSHNGFDSCEREFDEFQFGCSLLNINDVERIALMKTPTFKDFHPDLAQPWRIITCCWYYAPTEKPIFYTPVQIKEAVTEYIQISGDSIVLQIKEGTGKTLNEFPENAIVGFSEQAERNPFYRIVIRNTASLNLNRKSFEG